MRDKTPRSGCHSRLPNQLPKGRRRRSRGFNYLFKEIPQCNILFTKHVSRNVQQDFLLKKSKPLDRRRRPFGTIELSLKLIWKFRDSTQQVRERSCCLLGERLHNQISASHYWAVGNANGLILMAKNYWSPKALYSVQGDKCTLGPHFVDLF